MYTNSDRIGQLASAHHREMLADARRRQLRHQGRSAPRTPGTRSTITRGLGTALAKVGVAAARVPDAL
jgi:hypothetical protein